MAAAAQARVLTGLEKAAILLVALGDDASAALLRHMSDEEVQQVSEAIANLPAISPHEAEAILEQFQDATNGVSQLTQGGPEFARRVLTQAFGPDASKKHIERLPQGTGRQSVAQQQLQRVDPQL